MPQNQPKGDILCIDPAMHTPEKDCFDNILQIFTF